MVQLVDDDDVLQDPECLHFGVECEPPCTEHCSCNDCINSEDDEEDDEAVDGNPSYYYPKPGTGGTL